MRMIPFKQRHNQPRIIAYDKAAIVRRAPRARGC
jgi:hypothetical protein